jgi:hypothetical protein
MHPALLAVDQRYRTAAAVEVECHALEWPAMRDTIRLLRDLRREVDAGVSRQLEDLLVAAGRWSRLLTGAPLSPGADPVGTAGLASWIRRHRDAGLDSRLHAYLGRLAALLDTLADQAHPAAACLGDVISRYGRAAPDDPPPVYVAADAEQAALIRGWLAAEELDAEVRSVTHLRDAPVRDALVLLGPPARYLVSAWCGPTQAGRLTGWLLSAPPAAQVHVVTWPGHLRLDPCTVNLFPTTPAPPIRLAGPGPAAPGGAAVDDAGPLWLPPAAMEPRVTPAVSWTAERDPVATTAFRLAGKRVVFYPVEPGDDPDPGPSPEVVTWDGAAVYLTDAEPRQVRVGTVLLFRPERSATDAELHRRADALLAAKCGPGAPGAAKAAKAELKEALAATGPTDEVHALLSAALHNNYRYARHILMCLPDAGYIAPERPGAYAALRAALGLGPDPDGRAERLLRELRTACRRAGVAISAQLVATLRATTSWQADLEASGHATVSYGPLLGELDLRVVVAVDPTVRRIGRSHVGRQTRATGDPRQPAVVQEQWP